MSDEYERLLLVAIWQSKRISQLENKAKVYTLYKKGFEWFQKWVSTPKTIVC